MLSTADLVPIDVSARTAAEPSVEPIPGPGTNATRHLSAGAYLDDEFCLTALRRVYYQRKRIVAPSYGFDVVTVLGHCIRARRVMVVRDVLLVTLLLTALWRSPMTVLLVLLALLLFHVTVTAVHVGRESLEYLREPKQYDAADRTMRHADAGRARRDILGTRGFRRLWLENLVAAVTARVFGVALTYVGFAALTAVASIGLWRAGLLSGTTTPEATGALVTLCFLVPAVLRCWNRIRLRSLRPGSTVDRPVASERLRDIATQMTGNTVVYSGHRPFVGAGEILRRWDFTQRLVQYVPPELAEMLGGPMSERDKEFPAPPFTAGELSAYVRADLERIARDPLPEFGVPHLGIAELIFVAGTEISNLRPHTPPDQIAEIIRYPTAPQRHYLACQVVSWRGELVTTVYVHFAVQGKVLYVELYVTGLLPCDERFRVVDEVGGTGVKAVLRDAVHAMRSAPALVASAPANLIRYCGDRSRGGVGRLHKGYDYGARVGVREIGASADVRDHMQVQDIVKYGRIIERRVLAAILDFLDERGVDVAEYRQRSLTILNAGAVATSGGTVIVDGDAFGTQNTGEADQSTQNSGRTS